MLATFNGARFVREQIDSILAQTYSNFTILARDDGSSDGTDAILAEYSLHFPERVRILPTGTPSGSAKLNFARLLLASDAPYAACADQDDVWKPDKLAESMAAMLRLQHLHGDAKPLLVFTDLAVVDESLRVLQPSLWAYQHIRPEKMRTFHRLLTQNVVTGCTMLLNRPLIELAARMPAGAYMHDWWIALLASALGAFEYLPDQTVLYRQHSANLLGAAGHGGATGIPKWRYHAKRREQWEASARQAEAFLTTYGDEVPEHIRRLLRAYLRADQHPNRLVRTGTILRHGFFLQDLRPNLAILWYLWDMKAAKRADAYSP